MPKAQPKAKENKNVKKNLNYHKVKVCKLGRLLFVIVYFYTKANIIGLKFFI